MFPSFAASHCRSSGGPVARPDRPAHTVFFPMKGGRDAKNEKNAEKYSDFSNLIPRVRIVPSRKRSSVGRWRSGITLGRKAPGASFKKAGRNVFRRTEFTTKDAKNAKGYSEPCPLSARGFSFACFASFVVNSPAWLWLPDHINHRSYPSGGKASCRLPPLSCVSTFRPVWPIPSRSRRLLISVGTPQPPGATRMSSGGQPSVVHLGITACCGKVSRPCHSRDRRSQHGPSVGDGRPCGRGNAGVWRPSTNSQQDRDNRLRLSTPTVRPACGQAQADRRDAQNASVGRVVESPRIGPVVRAITVIDVAPIRIVDGDVVHVAWFAGSRRGTRLESYPA